MWVFLTLFDVMFASGYVGNMWCVGATEKYQAKPPTLSWKWKLLSSQDTTTLYLIIQYFHIPPFVPNKMKIQSLCARLQHHLQSDHRQLPLRHRVLLQPSPLLALCSLSQLLIWSHTVSEMAALIRRIISTAKAPAAIGPYRWEELSGWNVKSSCKGTAGAQLMQ